MHGTKMERSSESRTEGKRERECVGERGESKRDRQRVRERKRKREREREGGR